MSGVVVRKGTCPEGHCLLYMRLNSISLRPCEFESGWLSPFAQRRDKLGMAWARIGRGTRGPRTLTRNVSYYLILTMGMSECPHSVRKAMRYSAE